MTYFVEAFPPGATKWAHRGWTDADGPLSAVEMSLLVHWRDYFTGYRIEATGDDGVKTVFTVDSDGNAIEVDDD